MTRRFDAIIIGAGQAGPPLAARLSSAGQSVALIERKLFGGTCVNTGCMPTKTLIASAYAAQVAHRAAEYGVAIEGAVSVDFARVQARAQAVAASARGAIETMLRGLETCTVLQGQARFEGPRTVRVGEETIEAERIFINVGGRANRPDMSGIDEVATLDNSAMMRLDVLPRHLVVVGGSYIGLEFAQMYRRFGSEVTVVEKGPRLIGREDEDVSDGVRAILEAEGIAMRLSAECISFRPHGDDVAVGVNCADGEPEVIGSHVLLAIGRRPNTDDLGLDRAGVAVDARGYITVDDELRTSAEGVWALGDCNGRGAFTHTAYNDFEIVAANLLDGDSRRVSDRITAYALYTDPPLGRVGMSEAEARRSGRPLLVSKRPMSKVGRAIEKGETQGFMKVVADAETKRILGAAILGTGGDEAIHGLLDTMYQDAPYTTVARSVPIHPTVSELLPTLLQGLRPA